MLEQSQSRGSVKDSGADDKDGREKDSRRDSFNTFDQLPTISFSRGIGKGRREKKKKESDITKKPPL